jgi:hypothetical protein
MYVYIYSQPSKICHARIAWRGRTAIEAGRNSKNPRNQEKETNHPPIPRRDGNTNSQQKVGGRGHRGGQREQVGWAVGGGNEQGRAVRGPPCGRHARTRRGRRDDATPAAPPGPHRHGPAAAAMRLKTSLRACPRPPGPPLAADYPDPAAARFLIRPPGTPVAGRGHGGGGVAVAVAAQVALHCHRRRRGPPGVPVHAPRAAEHPASHGMQASPCLQGPSLPPRLLTAFLLALACDLACFPPTFL